ncbi:hypothetical protein ACQP0I_26350 [Micromonospora carbonacea]|uniref:hypothetical protein n=1 Tax=Micromonospora carbonacea TaxID=47853 RepID=UPI003D956F37
MEFLGYAAVQTATQLPTVLVLVTGLVLAAVSRHRLWGPSRALLLAGVVVLLVTALLNIAWLVALPQLYSSAWSSLPAGTVARYSAAVGVVFALLHPTGLGLVIAGALTGRAPHAAPVGLASATGSVSDSRRVATRQPSA